MKPQVHTSCPLIKLPQRCKKVLPGRMSPVQWCDRVHLEWLLLLYGRGLVLLHLLKDGAVGAASLRAVLVRVVCE